MIDTELGHIVDAVLARHPDISLAKLGEVVEIIHNAPDGTGIPYFEDDIERDRRAGKRG